MRKFALSALAAAVIGLAAVPSAKAVSEGSVALPETNWSWEGLFGTYDRAQLQRGYLVYKNVCAGCHSLRLMSYRNLAEIGFTEEDVKAIAAEYQVMDGPNDDGEMFERPARPSDRFVPPFPNDQAARASNNGALPPDLTLMTKARKGGADYVYGLLTGYVEPPAGWNVPEGMQYNMYFPGHNIAMAPPLTDDAVDYPEGTPTTLAQYAQDVTAFLNWTAEPELEVRKSMGIKVLLFLIALTALMYAAKRKVWADVH